MQSSHSLKRLSVAFSDSHAVAGAGLLLAATLAEKLGLRELYDQAVDLGEAPGRANVGVKALTLIYSALAGGDSIDDARVLGAGRTASVLGQELRAPSTLGAFLRSFRFGHALQLDVVSRQALARAWQAGAGPGPGPLTIDLDSTICETYGLKKAGGSRFTYTHVRGYHPLLAVLPKTGEVVHTQLRGGPAHTAQGAARFIAQTVARLRGAGAKGELTLRTDAGFFSEKVIGTCRKKQVRFSIGVPLHRSLAARIAALPEAAWQPIGYPLPGAAVTEIPYTAFGSKGLPVRLIVRRIPPSPGSQLALFATYAYHGFVTDREGDALELEADHRRHAEIENVIRDLKYGVGLNHLPSGRFGANAAWLALQVMAHNLGRWLGQLAGTPRLTTKTVRQRFFSLPGRLTRSARRESLALPVAWPWREAFLGVLHALRALPPPLPA
jgi:Transposase DDE domain group 1